MKSGIIARKLIILYTFIVIIPAVVIYIVYAAITFETLRKTGSEQYNSSLIKTLSELELSMYSVEKTARDLMSEEEIREYLRYPYESDWEPMYRYILSIQSIIRNSINYNPAIGDLSFYGDNVRLNPGGYFRRLSDRQPAPGEEAPYRENGWVIGTDHSMRYRITLQPERRSPSMIEVRLDSAFCESLMEKLLVDDRAYVCVTGPAGKLIYEEGIRPETGKLAEILCIRAASPIAGTDYIVEIAVPTRVRSYASVFITGLLLFVTLIGLLFLYLSYSLRFTRRINRFTEHIEHMPVPEYTAFTEPQPRDEVGTLVNAFNTMGAMANELTARTQNEELLRRRAELDALQSRIEPHFLYGTLESLRMLAEENSDRETASGILNLSKLFRYSLRSSRDSTIAEELDQVRRYLELEKLRLEYRLQWTITAEDPSITSEPCPAFLLQPLVENSIIHGIEHKRTGGEIAITLCRENNLLIIRVADTGAGMSGERLSEVRSLLASLSDKDNPIEGKDSGYALYNIGMRVRLYYGEEGSFEIAPNSPCGILCTLKLPPMKE